MSVLEQAMSKGNVTFPTSVTHPTTLSTIPITLDPRVLANPGIPPIDEKLYAGFLEHLGRCIYGGIVDNPKAPSPEGLLIKQERGRLGFRKDVVDVIGRKGELEVPMLRWPGGNYVSNYHWQDGIGPLENRPKRIELAWLSDESNLFGTDEFIDYCRETGAEPYICLNMGTGTLEEALAWLEYCNGKGNTYWANLRRKNTGRDEPHNVKYWGLGNEMWGPWQVGNMNVTEYAKAAKKWAHGLKLVDPSILLVSCGETGSTDWDKEVLTTCFGFVDLHSIHLYTMIGHNLVTKPGDEYEKNVFGPAAAERNIEVCQSLIDMCSIDRSIRNQPAREIKIAFDEWNVWDEAKAPGSVGLEQAYDYTDMLGFVAWLNVLVRKHKDLGLACLAQSVNVISPVMTRPDGILFQTTYYPLRLFSKYMKNGHLIHTPRGQDVYTGPAYPTFIQFTSQLPAYVDIVAVIVGTSVRVSVLNRHPTVDWQAGLDIKGYNVESLEIHEMYSDDLDAVNTWEKPNNVVPEVKKIDKGEWSGKWTVKKHSWSFFIFEGSVEK